MIIAGTMGIVALFIESKMPALLADLLIARMPNVKWAIIALSLFAGLVSAFVDNVATVLMVAPIALSLSKKLEISPVPGIIAIAVSSNLQGAATLVGDTTSIMLGSEVGMSFIDFFVMDGKMGMFWIVQIAALAATAYLLIVFRKDKQKIEYSERTEVKDFFPTFLLVAMLALLIGVSFIPEKPDVTPGIICVGLMVVGMIYTVIRRKDFSGVKNTLKEIDFKTLLLLAGIFLIIGGLDAVGIIDDIADILVKASGGSIFALYSLLVWASVLISAFIDNIPYVATMLPVITGIASTMGITPEQDHGPLSRSPLRRHPRRQPHSHRRLRQHHRHRHPPQSRSRSRHPPIYEDQRALHFDSGVSRIRSCLGSLRLTAAFGA